VNTSTHLFSIDSLFQQILKPALGCTEPVAVALASAAAAWAATGWTPGGVPAANGAGELRLLRVRVSRNIFKNTFAILIPNAGGHKGLLMSAALGVACDPREGMNIFGVLDEAQVGTAEALVQSGRVQVEIASDAPSDLYIEVEAEYVEGSGGCVIRDEHSNIACLRRNGQVTYGGSEVREQGEASPELAALKAMTLAQVVRLVDELPESVLALLRTTAEMNMAACKAGLTRPMGIGAGYFGTVDEDVNSFSQHLASLTAAGSDARMSGFPLEIMTSAGSGNQGIIATIPVIAYAKAHKVEERRMLQALALSHLVTMYMTGYIGYLSALCGVAIKAGIGASCGVAYAMGGAAEEVERAVKIMAATLTGMICDGAKIGCALKVSNASEMAVRSAELAMRKAEVPDDNGIVAPTAEETIRNLAELGRSMEIVDQKIIEIMLKKLGPAAAQVQR
jgi:L-cysteine desulfidase